MVKQHWMDCHCYCHI